MTNVKIVIGAILMIAMGYSACWHLNPQTIDIVDYQLLNEDFVERMREANCIDDILEVRKKLENKFQQALIDREIQCDQWEVCDCTDNITIIESNCDTIELDEYIIELEDTLEDCADANDILTTQVYNLMYQ